MIPPKSDPRWASLARGDNQHQFQQTALAMYVARVQRQVKHNPSHLPELAEELHTFCTKYESLLGNDLMDAFNQKGI